MFGKRQILNMIITIGFVYSQFPIELNPNQISEPITFSSSSNTEFLITISASSNTNWSESDSESATLVISIDGDWINYNQDIILYSGSNLHNYHSSLGPIDAGEHIIQFKFDYEKSSIGANQILINDILLTNINNLNIDQDVFKYSPILYGRDLLSWNESTHTDIPLIMWHEITQEDENKRITYSIIFSNEDSRVGVGLADLMFSYGRTTDIEWVYRVELDCDGAIIDEQFQGASHTTTDFTGNKINQHPILKNATLNCNFTDIGISDYKFFLAPINQERSGTRQVLMDDNPWSYRIMGEELINENRYEVPADSETLEISDVRNYVYIEYGFEPGQNPHPEPINIQFYISFFDDCTDYFNNHSLDELSTSYNTESGYQRTSIELPVDFEPNNISSLGLINSGAWEMPSFYMPIISFFYLDSNYIPIDIPLVSDSIHISSDNLNGTSNTLNSSNTDCLGEENGEATCDDCGVCNGNNLDLDDCGVCFGNNMDMDCAGICFGSAQLDECGICDNNMSNDNTSCSGCTDINATNFDEGAIFYDGSCMYIDNIFLVPTEYASIQSAIFFASDGDTVEVGSGTYNENINFMGKSIVLQAEPNLAIAPHIAAIDSTSTITIENSLNASVTGFMITNGYGSGVSFDDFISLASDPIAFDSLITNVLRGGGLSIINSSPHLKDLHITNNVSRNVGAGIGLINSSSVIESCIIDNNTIPDGDALGGGGIAINGGAPTFIDVEITNNIVGTNMYYLNGGGGILCGFSFGDQPLSLNMYNTTIFNNQANIGGGIGALSGNIYIERTLISQNIGEYGSAISMGEPLGLVVGDINMNLINSTITDNSGVMTIGMINSANLNILNSIFWNNNGIFSPMPNNDQLNIEGVYSLFENDLTGVGNISSNPLFINSENNNYELSEDSPCIDSGINYFDFNNGVSIEITSYYDNYPDMGAYEFSSSSTDCTESLGDVNSDGVVDILDILQTVNLIMEFVELTDEELCIVDINEDYTLDIFDIILLINIILSI